MFGLRNCGATCYMNAVIQCIYSSPVLIDALSKYTGDCKFTNLLKDPAKNIASIIAHFPKFALGTPYDSHEALLSIIDVIEHSLGRELFYGEYKTKYVSKTESHEKSYAYSMLMFYPGDDGNLCTLFEESEKMEYITKQNNEFVCKRVTYTSFPKVIICMFWNRRSITLPDTFKDKKLRSIVIHIGHESAGHYVALIRRDDEWYLADDESIRKIGDLPSSIQPYLAFYSD